MPQKDLMEMTIENEMKNLDDENFDDNDSEWGGTEMSSIQHRRKVVEQLGREAAIRRINVSTAIEDLKKYIEEHKNEDYILIGFHSQKANPFREKSSCIIL